MIEFKGVHYPKSVILHAVFFYLRYAVSVSGGGTHYSSTVTK